MRTIILIACLLLNNVCFAQTIKNVSKGDVIINEYRDSTITIVGRDHSLLAQGNYKLKIGDRTAVDFQINDQGQAEGNILVYRDNGNVGRRTTIEHGKMTMVVNYREDGLLTDSTKYGLENIELYDPISKKFIPKEVWVNHKYEYKRSSNQLNSETKYCSKNKMMTKTFYAGNRVKSIELCGQYEELYDENGLLNRPTNYNWKTREITKLYFEKGKLRSSEVAFNDKYIWNDGQVNRVVLVETIELVDGKMVQKANKNYTITSDYYPDGKIESIKTERNGEILLKEYSPTGKLLKQAKRKVDDAPVMMIN